MPNRQNTRQNSRQNTAVAPMPATARVASVKTSSSSPERSSAASSTPPSPPSLAVRSVSYLIMALLCAVALSQGLLPGLLAVCLGYLLTHALRQPIVFGNKAGQPPRRLPAALAATLVIAAPIALLVFALSHAKGVTLSATGQYKELLQHLAQTVLDIRSKLPADLAKSLPEGTAALQLWLAEHLRAQASGIANTGKVWLHGMLLAYVGLVVGSLVAVSSGTPSKGPLAVALRGRATRFIDAFTKIMAAQFWIAAFNTSLTAIFLLIALPAFQVEMPYAYVLLMMTFTAGLIPIVGNLLCNVVLAVVGVSVSPMVGVACLSFLIAIHKTEYFINAKVVGGRTQTAAWELLTAMFACEALFGVSGLVAAPLYYAYLKMELKDSGLV